LEEVPLAHLVFTVAAIGLVVVEVDLPEKPADDLVSALYLVALRSFQGVGWVGLKFLMDLVDFG
jgi:hypothetical protein